MPNPEEGSLVDFQNQTYGGIPLRVIEEVARNEKAGEIFDFYNAIKFLERAYVANPENKDLPDMLENIKNKFIGALNFGGEDKKIFRDAKNVSDFIKIGKVAFERTVDVLYDEKREKVSQALSKGGFDWNDSIENIPFFQDDKERNEGLARGQCWKEAASEYLSPDEELQIGLQLLLQRYERLKNELPQTGKESIIQELSRKNDKAVAPMLSNAYERLLGDNFIKGLHQVLGDDSKKEEDVLKYISENIPERFYSAHKKLFDKFKEDLGEDAAKVAIHQFITFQISSVYLSSLIKDKTMDKTTAQEVKRELMDKYNKSTRIPSDSDVDKKTSYLVQKIEGAPPVNDKLTKETIGKLNQTLASGEIKLRERVPNPSTQPVQVQQQSTSPPPRRRKRDRIRDRVKATRGKLRDARKKISGKIRKEPQNKELNVEFAKVRGKFTSLKENLQNEYKQKTGREPTSKEYEAALQKELTEYLSNDGGLRTFGDKKEQLIKDMFEEHKENILDILSKDNANVNVEAFLREKMSESIMPQMVEAQAQLVEFYEKYVNDIEEAIKISGVDVSREQKAELLGFGKSELDRAKRNLSDMIENPQKFLDRYILEVTNNIPEAIATAARERRIEANPSLPKSEQYVQFSAQVIDPPTLTQPSVQVLQEGDPEPDLTLHILPDAMEVVEQPVQPITGGDPQYVQFTTAATDQPHPPITHSFSTGHPPPYTSVPQSEPLNIESAIKKLTEAKEGYEVGNQIRATLHDVLSALTKVKDDPSPDNIKNLELKIDNAQAFMKSDSNAKEHLVFMDKIKDDIVKPRQEETNTKRTSQRL